jgi:hypothetical protein
MVLRHVPQVVLHHFIDAYPQSFVQFWASQGIVCLTVDDNIRQFFPAQLLLGQKVAMLGNNSAGKRTPRIDVDEAAVVDWIKTRRGYVPADCHEFATALHRQSLGAFDSPQVTG